MALGSTQLLTEMSTRSVSWGKGGRCVRLTTLPPSCAVIMKSGNLSFLEPSGSVQACNGIALPLPLPYWVRLSNCNRWSIERRILIAASQGKQQNFLSRHSKKRIVYVFRIMEHSAEASRQEPQVSFLSD